MKGEIKVVHSEIRSLGQRLDQRIDAFDQKLSARIDGLDQKMDGMDERLTIRIDNLEKKLDVVQRLAVVEAKVDELRAK